MAFFLGSFSCYITDIAATFYTVLMAGEKIQLSSQAASLWLRCGERLSLSLRIEAVTKVFCGSSLISGNLLHRRIAKLRLRAIVYLPRFWSRKKWYSCLWEFLFQLSFLFMSSTRNFYLHPSYLVLVWSKVIWRRTKKAYFFLIRHLPIYLRPTTNHEDNPLEFPRCIPVMIWLHLYPTIFCLFLKLHFNIV